MNRSQSDTAIAETTELWFTTTITQRVTVRRQVPYTGHPDYVDKEAAALALDQYIEAHYGDLPPDVIVDHAFLESETEAW